MKNKKKEREREQVEEAAESEWDYPIQLVNVPASSPASSLASASCLSLPHRLWPHLFCLLLNSIQVANYASIIQSK